MKSNLHVVRAPKGNARDHKAWINPGTSKMSWRMIFKLLLLMALDDWDWRRRQKRNKRKLEATQRQRIGRTQPVEARVTRPYGAGDIQCKLGPLERR